MGTETQMGEPQVAVVRCKGGKKEAKDKYEYFGVPTCVAANLVDEGPKACHYGCLEFGDCCQVCVFDALQMGDNGLPVVDDGKCTGCGLCVTACPRKVMEMIPRRVQIYLACRSQDRGKTVKEVCEVGCNGCTLCANPKVTTSGAIKMEGYLPREDWSIEDNLVTAAYKCPTNSFVDKIKYRPKFTIDSKCNSCGKCVEVCPVKDCIEGEAGQVYVIDQELCIGCGRCLPVCKPRAIYMMGALAYQTEEE
jgi:Fe-S-cluster-containing hydrogenase component 2